MIVMRIAGAPPRQFYKDAAALPLLDPAEASHGLLESVGTLRASTDGTVANITVRLRNGSAECAGIFRDPPLGARAELRDAAGVVFAGTVASVTLGNPCELGIEG